MTPKDRALDESVPLSRGGEDALKEALAKPNVARKPVKLATASGAGVKPGVDLDSGRSLRDIMDDLS